MKSLSADYRRHSGMVFNRARFNVAVHAGEVTSRELGLAVPFRVSPLILHIQAESCSYLRDYSPFLLPATVPIRTGIHQRASPEFILCHAISLPLVFTTWNLPT